MGVQFYPQIGVVLSDVTERSIIEKIFVKEKSDSFDRDETWLKNNKDSTERVVKYLRSKNREFVTITYLPNGEVLSWESGDHLEVTRKYVDGQIFAKLLVFLSR